MRSRSVAALFVASVAAPAALTAQDLSISDVRAVERDAGVRTVEVTVVIAQAAARPITVNYATRNGTATEGVDYRAATGTLTFAAGDRSQKIAIGIVGETAVEPDETFDVILSAASGATIGDDRGTATIVNDDGLDSPGLAIYEVQLIFVGSTGAFAASDCPTVRANGTVVMTGLIAGNEGVSRDDDIEYTGILQMDTDIDLCEVTRRANGQDEFCTLTVVGAGPMRTQLDVYTDNRGAYVEAATAPGTSLVSVSGSCGQEMISEERAAFPDDSKASVFNGEEFPLRSGPLRVGRYTTGQMTLEVLRVVRTAPQP